MTLWHKPIHEIDIDDVDDFCKSEWEESIRLDYKGGMPGDLAKTMAAMANTVGGMIILGIDADTKTNKPKWPSPPLAPQQSGLPLTKGLSEKIYQLARDAIFPPLSVEVSSVIPNPHIPNHAILIIRIPESKDAPHATDGKTNVCIYERTGNQNFQHKQAEIDYIERLILRRRTSENAREEQIQQAIKRGKTRINFPHWPFCWASVIPFYPWKPICSPEECFKFYSSCSDNPRLRHMSFPDFQRVPGGAFSTFKISRPDQERRRNHACGAITETGHISIIKILTNEDNEAEKGSWVSHYSVTDVLNYAIRLAKGFYDKTEIAQPAYLQVSFGLDGVLNYMMQNDATRRIGRDLHPFPDENFRADAVFLDFHNLAEKEIEKPLLSQLCFGFGLREDK